MSTNGMNTSHKHAQKRNNKAITQLETQRTQKETYQNPQDLRSLINCKT